ncbi:hypothetical protein D3C80_1673700 [compost metagenome]
MAIVSLLVSAAISAGFTFTTYNSEVAGSFSNVFRKGTTPSSSRLHSECGTVTGWISKSVSSTVVIELSGGLQAEISKVLIAQTHIFHALLSMISSLEREPPLKRRSKKRTTGRNVRWPLARAKK